MDLTALPTWIGITLGAITTAAVTWLVFAATRRKDHLQRRWERQVEVYERVLLEAAAWTADRAKAMHTLPADGGSAIAALDEVERRRTRIRLRMFGHQEVRDAFERYADAHWTWADIQAALNELYATQHQVNAGELPAHQDMSEEIHAKQSEAKAAQKRADQAETELIDTIEQVLKRVPKSTR